MKDNPMCESRLACLLDAGHYKPGDPPPDGYNQWHEWARIQHKAGLRQKMCGRCSCWMFPQELSGERSTYEAFKSNGQKVIVSNPICKGCAGTH